MPQTRNAFTSECEAISAFAMTDDEWASLSDETQTRLAESVSQRKEMAEALREIDAIASDECAVENIEATEVTLARIVEKARALLARLPVQS